MEKSFVSLFLKTLKSSTFKQLFSIKNDILHNQWRQALGVSVEGLSLGWNEKMPQVIEALAAKFQGLGCLRTWEITILVKSRDQWCYAFQWGF